MRFRKVVEKVNSRTPNEKEIESFLPEFGRLIFIFFYMRGKKSVEDAI